MERSRYRFRFQNTNDPYTLGKVWCGQEDSNLHPSRD